MTRSHTLPVVALSVALAGACWGGTLLAVPQPVGAQVVGGVSQTVAWGQPISLGAWEATVPTPFIASQGASATVTPVENDTDETTVQEVQDLTRVWSLSNYLELETPSAGTLASGLMSAFFTLDAMPCPEIEPATAALLNGTDGPEGGLDGLLAYLTGGQNAGTGGGTNGSTDREQPTYLGFLPYQDNEAAFNLVFLDGCYEGRIMAVAALPPNEGTSFVTLVTAIIPSQGFEELLPSVDQLFASVVPAQSETDRAAEALASYKEQRGR